MTCICGRITLLLTKSQKGSSFELLSHTQTHTPKYTPTYIFIGSVPKPNLFICAVLNYVTYLVVYQCQATTCFYDKHACQSKHKVNTVLQVTIFVLGGNRTDHSLECVTALFSLHLPHISFHSGMLYSRTLHGTKTKTRTHKPHSI